MAVILQPALAVRHNGHRWHIVARRENDIYRTHWTACNRFYEGSDPRTEVAAFAAVPAAGVCGLCLRGFSVADTPDDR